MPDVWTQFEAGYSDIEELLAETAREADDGVRQFAWRWQRTALIAWAARAHLAVEKRIYLRLPRSPQAQQLIERGLEEHLAIHALLSALERVAGCDPRTWRSSFEQLRTMLELHAFEAEAVLIPYAAFPMCAAGSSPATMSCRCCCRWPGTSARADANAP